MGVGEWEGATGGVLTGGEQHERVCRRRGTGSVNGRVWMRACTGGSREPRTAVLPPSPPAESSATTPSGAMAATAAEKVMSTRAPGSHWWTWSKAPAFDWKVPALDWKAPTFDGKAPAFMGKRPSSVGKRPRWIGKCPRGDYLLAQRSRTARLRTG